MKSRTWKGYAPGPSFARSQLVRHLHQSGVHALKGHFIDAGTAAVTYLTILILLSRQMTRSSTPSGISRVSRYTFLVQSTIDSVSFAGHVTFAVLAEGRPSLSLIAPSFLACVIFLYEAVSIFLSQNSFPYLRPPFLFHQQFSMNIHQIQLPEDAPPPRPPVTVPAVPVTAPSPVRGTAPQVVSTPSSLNTDSPTDPPNSPTVPIDNAPAAATQPATVTPTPPQNVTFWTFFWQQVRTDPQARLCESYCPIQINHDTHAF